MTNAKKTEKKVIVVPALEKALDITEYLAQQGRYVTLKEISKELALPPVTTYRTVKYLCSRGYLKENPRVAGEYYLGPQLLYLAHQISKQSDLVAEASPIMRKLAVQTGQTAQLGVLQDYGVVYIEQKLPTQPVSIIAALRTVLPVNVSASGKVLVAHLPPHEQDEFLQHAKLVPQTENSITQVDAFKLELARVKERGYALDMEEYARGIGCAAAPIYDHRGQVIAAIGITGHIADYQDETRLKRLIALVREAADEISRHTNNSDSSRGY